MLNFLDWLVDFFKQVWAFISNFFESTITALSVVSQVPNIAVTLIGYVPAVVGSCITIVIAIGVLKLILGWGNS